MNRTPITTYAAILLVSGVLGGCGSPPEASNVSLTLNPNERAPLAAILELETSAPAVVTLAIDDGDEIVTVTPQPEPATEHSIPVLGLLPDREHTVSVTLTDSSGRHQTELEPLTVTTDPLPEDFPPISVPTRRPQQMEPGVTLVPVFRWSTEEPGEDDDTWGVVFATDAEGRVRWYYQADSSLSEVRRLSNGNLFFLGGRTGRLFEIDMLGNQVAAWHSRLVKDEYIPEGSLRVETDTFHHDVIELPNGHFLALSTEARAYDEYPTAYGPEAPLEPRTLIGDTLTEFRRDASIVKTVRVLDLLDPYRLGPGSLSTGFYEDEYEDVLETPGNDWAHSNAVLYDEGSGRVIVSSNYQSAHYAIDWESGELAWIIGDPAQWRAPWSDKLIDGPAETWTYNQHGSELTPEGHLLVFDNGGSRSIPPAEGLPPEEAYSRAVELAIDEEAGSVRLVWSYGPEQERFVSPFLSDADHLPTTGNVLITDGGKFADADGNELGRFGGRNWARVLEVTRDAASEKLWELVIDSPSRGYSVYRSQRIASLYPALDRPTG